MIDLPRFAVAGCECVNPLHFSKETNEYLYSKDSRQKHPTLSAEALL
jgi:hypothetical protein